jgi:hypothetical protein
MRTALCLSVLFGAGLLAPAEPPRREGFTIVTKECGLEAVVDEQYKSHPEWWLSGLHLVDLDGDGHLDFFMSAHGGGGALAALNDGAGKFVRAPGSYPATEIHLPCDINEDGKVDLAMTYQDGGGQWWLNQSKPGALDFKATDLLRGGNTDRINVLLDINRDGKNDWIRSQGPGLVFDIGDGGGRFASGELALRIGDDYKFEYSVVPADINGDGEIDLLVEWGRYKFAQGKSRIYRNDGKLQFTDVTREAGLTEDGTSIKGVGDFNHDGHIDLVVLEKNRLEIYMNDGTGKFVKKEGAIQGLKGTAAYASWGIAVFTDFDNDGIGDLLVNGKHFLKLLRGLGDGRFEVMNGAWGISDYSACSVDDGLCFGDIDNDGRLDIIGYRPGEKQRRFDVYHNDLPRRHWLRVRPLGRPGNRAAAGAKIRLFAPGSDQLLAYEEVAIYGRQEAHSYYSPSQTERHFGLGDRERVDVSVEFYPSRKVVWTRGAEADRAITVRED